jgi:hypothetical protein
MSRLNQNLIPKDVRELGLCAIGTSLRQLAKNLDYLIWGISPNDKLILSAEERILDYWKLF